MGTTVTGFMRRFLDQHGPGPHHLTFTVPSLDDALAAVGELGIEVLGGRSTHAIWQEAFLHPKLCGVGTLVQLVQKDEVVMAALEARSPEPPDFPRSRGEQQVVAWVGLTVVALEHAEALLVGALQGVVVERGPGWMLIGWGPGRALLVRSSSAAASGVIAGHAWCRGRSTHCATRSAQRLEIVRRMSTAPSPADSG
jgi:hypothetical protein